MDESRLNLLTREGAVTVLFKPALDDSQYAELLDLAKSIDGYGPLCQVVYVLAKRWQRQVTVDPC
jgi:hypothetical protein